SDVCSSDLFRSGCGLSHRAANSSQRKPLPVCKQRFSVGEALFQLASCACRRVRTIAAFPSCVARPRVVYSARFRRFTCGKLPHRPRKNTEKQPLMTCPPQVDRAASAHTQTAAVWTAVLARLRTELPGHAAAHEAWLEPLVARVGPDGLQLACPNAFHLERVRERYLERIERCAGAIAGVHMTVTLLVDASLCSASAARASAAPAAAPARLVPAATIGARVVPPRERPEAPPEPDLPAHHFAGFVVGEGNALAREASFALSHGRQLKLSPLYLYGGRGCGKTHLAVAVAHEARARGERVLYVSAEQFTNELMAAIRSQRTEEFKRRHREAVDLLVFEDVQFL